MKWLRLAFLAILSLLLLLKGTEIWVAAGSNGSADITFIGMVIYENALSDSLPALAMGFYIAALVPLMRIGAHLIKDRLQQEQ